MSRRVANPIAQESLRHNPREARCTGKEGFATAQAAQAVVKRMARNKQRVQKDGVPRAYRCSLCGQHHISRVAHGSVAIKAPDPKRPRRPKHGKREWLRDAERDA